MWLGVGRGGRGLGAVTGSSSRLRSHIGIDSSTVGGSFRSGLLSLVGRDLRGSLGGRHFGCVVRFYRGYQSKELAFGTARDGNMVQ